ncbi:4-O-beta-D-mannosyl-D-glucose phosphorylase [Salinimicrobium marinum]|uniref:4-O-beta-D-mannosyl-D-glucose phosphorylase n=1 Tax=Salinimicrobium marinum TaxID=680283 RepID=A0A918SJ25_9FLAO|nr:glycosidase [Salinimicrobium marinum]GHA41847.1 4-O-beta-D-mannosyl-D-glucose phosphorylase [Salinimicrobium marinum]
MKMNMIPQYETLMKEQKEFLQKKNRPVTPNNGIYERYENPVVTAAHAPLHWRYDFHAETNPLGLERIGVNATFNPGAIKWKGKYVLAVRVEGSDRKSYFAMAESPNGVDNFRFWDKPVVMPQLEEPDTNVYDMRLTAHEDGWIYGVFCTERKDKSNPDTTAAVANAGIARTKDLVKWERLPDLISTSGQQRNVVLHPEFVDGKYALYTRPQDGFIEVGKGGGIGLGYVKSMENPVLEDEKIINHKAYHTIYELKNGLGPAPIKTEEGWLHLAHGVRNTAGGLRYTLYLFMTDLSDISKVIYQPAGYFMAPNYQETVGDVPNVLFGNGWITDDDGTVYIYYASSDTRCHVAVSSVRRLVDYVKNTPQDGFISAASVQNIINLVDRNKELE